MRWLAIALCCFLLGCTNRDPLEEAKAVITSHERYVKAGDLNGVMGNIADDVVVLTPDTLLVKGTQAFRGFYTWTLSWGRWDIVHQYEGADVSGDAAVVYGLVRSTLTQQNGTVTNFSNNFLMILRYQEDGRMKFWRIAYAPGTR